MYTTAKAFFIYCFTSFTGKSHDFIATGTRFVQLYRVLTYLLSDYHSSHFKHDLNKTTCFL